MTRAAVSIVRSAGWLWPDGNLGTTAFILPSGDDAVIVLIYVVGVAP
jgi:hypothetical protein